jgi:hypothetical protein
MGEGPKEKKQGKRKKEQPFDNGAPSFAPPPPPPDDQAAPPSAQPYEGDMAPPSQPMGGDGQRRERDGKSKKKKDKGCPEGTFALDDGTCAPAQ